MGNRVAAIGLAGLLATSGVLAASGAEAGLGCREDTVWLRGEFGKARFTVDLADDAEERARGLMFVEKMPASRGMLFAYGDEGPRGFWMKNTLIPLDMIFADASGTVVSVHANAKPHDTTTIWSGAPAKYVLEINGGMASMLGITPGVELRHPVIEEAAWACE